MDEASTEAVLLTQLSFMMRRLDEAASLSRAAEACGKAGDLGKAIEIALDTEQLTYEANVLLNAASLMHRIIKQKAAPSLSFAPRQCRSATARHMQCGTDAA
jgi:hypothetical protein